MAIKFKGLSIIQNGVRSIELYDGEGVEICNSVQSLIKVLSYYDAHSELPHTSDIRDALMAEAIEEDDDWFLAGKTWEEHYNGDDNA